MNSLSSTICVLSVIAAALVTTARGTDASWRDSIGRSCSDYMEKHFCSGNKLETMGLGWTLAHGKLSQFSDYADKYGKHAGDMCCDCMLPSSTAYASLSCNENMREPPAEWIDSTGRSCADYSQLQLCNGGEYGMYTHCA